MEIFWLLKTTFRDFYQDLFKLVLLSTAWFTITSFLLFLIFIALNSGLYLLLIFPFLFLAPIFLTALFGADKIVKKGELKLKSLFTDFKDNFFRALISFIFTAVLYLIFIIDLRFFLLKGQNNVWLLAFAFLFAYLIIYFSIYQAYLWALLVIQADRSLKTVFKNAVILSLDNIIFSLFWFLSLFLLTVLLFITGIGIPAGFIGIIGILILKGAAEMTAKY